MVVESFRTTGGGACEVALREVINGTEVAWNFSLASPASLVLAFLNEEYGALLPGADGEAPANDMQELYLREVFTRGNGPLLRDMIDHVLVCEQERGFDPVARLAAYSFANEMFDLSRIASYAQRVSLETTVIGSSATEMMSKHWSGLLEKHRQQLYPRREDLFAALVGDAAARGYPFELGISMEYSSLPQLLKAFAVDMIRGRKLLRRCKDCGRYTLAEDEVVCGCGEGEEA